MRSEPLTKLPLKFRRFFLYGALFEIGLIVSAFGLPHSNLAIEITNFAKVVHFPLLMLLAGVGGESDAGATLALVLGLGLMASLWGFLFLQMARVAGRLRAHLSRRQKLAFWFVAGVGGLVLLGQAIASALPRKPIPFVASPEIKAVVEGNNAFALDLYQKLRGQPGNLFLSPFSISTALAMTSAGARGQTEVEMTNVMHLNLPPEKLHPAFRALIARMDRIQRWNRIILKAANSLWCQQDYPFVPEFLKLLRENYSAEAKSVDFKNSPGVAAQEINHWVKEKTDHKIPGGLDPSQLSPPPKLVLCDAIYFKGKWQHQFEEKDTQPGPFHVTTNETVMVPMMHQVAEFKRAFSEDESVEMLELPYSGQDLSMMILLPSPPEYAGNSGHNDIFDLEPKLTADNLHAWLAKLNQADPHKISVRLPRFTTTSSLDLTNELKSLGITSAFDNTADFSGMDGTNYLYLSEVIHKTFVEVNEAGTEAAAVTLVLAMSKGGGPERFHVDRPFIFLIRDNGSGSILFLGRIIDPTK